MKNFSKFAIILSIILFVIASSTFAANVSAVSDSIILLQNDYIKLAVDKNCRIRSLTDLRNNRDWSGAHGIWRILYKTPDGIDEQWADLSKSSCKKIGDNAVAMKFDGKFKICITAELRENSIIFSATIENNSDVEIYEFQFPMLKSSHIIPQSKLYLAGVEIAADIPVFMESVACESVRPEHKAKNFYSSLKKGKKSFAILEADNALIFSIEDSHTADISAFVRAHKETIIDFAFAQSIKILPAENFTSAKFAISLAETLSKSTTKK